MILLTNDDGITAPSLRELKKILSETTECFVIAPHDQKSASAHAISLGYDIEVSKYSYDDAFFGFQVKGTPVDCVKLALCELLKEPPQLIISGVNRGPNTGVSVYYSGTVAAAREGLIAGIPSIAVSMCSFDFDDFTYAHTLIKKIVPTVLHNGLPAGIMLNINIPPCAADDIKGIKITKQAHSRFIERYVKKGENEKSTLYALAGELELVDDEQNNDEQAVKDGYVSITPLHLDLTSFAAFKDIERLVRQ